MGCQVKGSLLRLWQSDDARVQLHQLVQHAACNVDVIPTLRRHQLHKKKLDCGAIIVPLLRPPRRPPSMRTAYVHGFCGLALCVCVCVCLCVCVCVCLCVRVGGRPPGAAHPLSA